MEWSWVPEQSHDASKVDLQVIDGIPILVHRGGHYPSAVRSDGTRSGDVPHVTVVQWAVTWSAGAPVMVWIVSACTGYVRGHGTQLEVGRAEALEDALALLPAAVERAHGARDEVAAAWMEIGKASGGPVDRAAYEALCAAFGVTPQSDQEIAGHLGAPAWPENTIETVQKFRLACRRQTALRQEMEAAAQTERERAQAERDRLGTAPVVETYETLLPAQSGHVGYAFIEGGRLHTVVASQPTGRITAGARVAPARMGRGRPPLPPGERRDVRVAVPVRPDTKAAWDAAAAERGVSTAAMIRDAVEAYITVHPGPLTYWITGGGGGDPPTGPFVWLAEPIEPALRMALDALCRWRSATKQWREDGEFNGWEMCYEETLLSKRKRFSTARSARQFRAVLELAGRVERAPGEEAQEADDGTR